MTLDATQHRLPVRTVLLQRMRLVIERDFAVLIRLAVFSERDLFGLNFALFFLGENKGHTTEGQQQDEKDLHDGDVNDAVDRLSNFF